MGDEPSAALTVQPLAAPANPPVLIACSHGTSSELGQRAIAQLVEAVRERRPGVEVRDAFVDVQEPSITTVLNSIDGPSVIVPLLLSSGYHVHVDLAAAADTNPQARLVGALGPDARLIGVLADRYGELATSGDEAIILASAGSSDSRAVADCASTARLLSARIGRPVLPAYLSAVRPSVSEAVEAAAGTGRRVVVISYLLAPGYFQGLIAESGADLWTPPLLDGGAPKRGLVDLVIERYEAGQY